MNINKLKVLKYILGVIVVLLMVCGASAQAPKLVVLITVDQMRQDYFDRFGEYFEGGLKRLWDSGAVFTQAYHGQAPSTTAPGHACISSGKYPYQHEIINNDYYDRRILKGVYCVEDPGVQILGPEGGSNLPGRSPKNFKGGSIGDWIKKANSGSKVFSVARKDRSAILMGGEEADFAFWLDNLTGRFVSSTYYGSELPDWVEGFDTSNFIERLNENGWQKKLPEQAYAHLRDDRFEREAGVFLPDFPHTRDRMRPRMPEATKDEIMMTVTPMGDDLVLKFARRLINMEHLGADEITDLLVVSCSAADAIGHHFGPESHEVMDYYLHLDGYLEEFLDFLDSTVGQENYWVVLTSDHGVIEMPEVLQERGIEARRIPGTYFNYLADSIETAIKQEFGITEPLFEAISDGIYLNFRETDLRGLSRSNVRTVVAKAFRSFDFFADVFTADELKSKEDRPYIQYYRNGFVEELSPDIIFHMREHVLIYNATGTTHGTPYAYDTHVPIIISGHGIPVGRFDRSVHVVDIAPTLAHLLNLKADKKVDGSILSEVASPGQ